MRTLAEVVEMKTPMITEIDEQTNALLWGRAQRIEACNIIMSSMIIMSSKKTSDNDNKTSMN